MPSRVKTGRPAKTAKPKKKSTKPRAQARGGASAGPKLVVKQVKSGIGHAETYRLTLRALGLRHHQAEIVVSDNPSIRGIDRKSVV